MTKPWHRRARHAVGHSLKVRLVLVFLLLAGAMAFTFISGVQKALSVGWRDGARPMLMDYVDRLAADITVDKGGPPSIERAKAITQRLPVTVSITGPQINWQSHPGQSRPEWQRDGAGSEDDWNRERWGGSKDWQRLLSAPRQTATPSNSASTMRCLNAARAWSATHSPPCCSSRCWLWCMYAACCARWTIFGEGATRFGAGDFSQPIPRALPNKPDELGELAATINTMGADIHQMLDAKRALLLAISHELRSPLTRARLNTELLPETPDVQPSREALLRDLALMRDLVTDLLESERLASLHVALQREPTDMATLAAEVVRDVVASLPDDPATTQTISQTVTQNVAADVPRLSLDRTRMRLLLRNLLDNALRHNLPADGSSPQPVEIDVRGTPEGGALISVRDFGPGVEEAALPHLAEPFYRPDAARERATGGVGLGLYLCKLVAQAHGGTFSVRNAGPGLEVCVRLPG
jgi:signal transduction histidine kinase